MFVFYFSTDKMPRPTGYSLSRWMTLRVVRARDMLEMLLRDLATNTQLQLFRKRIFRIIVTAAMIIECLNLKRFI